MCGVDDSIHDVGIAPSGNVVEASAEGEVVAENVKSFFELQVEREVIGITLAPGLPMISADRSKG